MKERNEIIRKINELLNCLEIEQTVDLEKLRTPILKGVYVNLVIRALNKFNEEVL